MIAPYATSENVSSIGLSEFIQNRRLRNWSSITSVVEVVRLLRELLRVLLLREVVSSQFLSFLLLPLMSLLAICVSGPITLAQDDENVAVGEVDQLRFTLSEQQFDQTVFNVRSAVVFANGGRLKQVVVAQSAPVEQAKSQLETHLNAEIATIDLRCKLTDAQKKKLRLAGRGDIADFFARAMELRRRGTSGPMTQQEFTQLHAEMQGLSLVIQMGSGSDSTLFRKTLRRLLTDEQAGLYRAFERERRVAMITETLAIQWGQNAKPVRLTAETQQKFAKVLLKHGRLPTNQSPYRQFLVLLEIDRLEDRLKPLLSDEEWQQFQVPLGQAKRVEPFLRTSGQWPIEATDDEASADAIKE
ncbi:MAG: hypothetical protein NT013_05435 [Planctomycetia bacterium]|nr:hypothetical protein [Planctomycetia bacterium]